MKIASEMTKESEIIAEEHCYFDGKEKRCKQSTTLTASTYHPFLQKQVSLATMECKSEDSENVGRFWSNFNKAFKEANATELKFMPIGWVSDMATSNFNGLQFVYGDEVKKKVKGCEFQFQHSINKRKSYFKDDEKEQTFLGSYFGSPYFLHLAPLSNKRCT